LRYVAVNRQAFFTAVFKSEGDVVDSGKRLAETPLNLGKHGVKTDAISLKVIHVAQAACGQIRMIVAKPKQSIDL